MRLQITAFFFGSWRFVPPPRGNSRRSSIDDVKRSYAVSSNDINWRVFSYACDSIGIKSYNLALLDCHPFNQHVYNYVRLHDPHVRLGYAHGVDDFNHYSWWLGVWRLSVGSLSVTNIRTPKVGAIDCNSIFNITLWLPWVIFSW